MLVSLVLTLPAAALMVGTGRGAQLGILLKGPEVLESSRAVDTIVLDKTGTITQGRMSLVRVDGDPETLRLAGALEAGSEHPIAQAIAAAADAPLPGITGFANREGWDDRVRGVLTVSDTVKPTSAEAVRRLRELGLRPVLLTGDNAGAAGAVAAEVGIGDVIADVLPQGKVEAVRRLQAGGAVVAMVCDGVSDAAALAQADLGLAMGTGTDVAIEASDLTVVRGDLNVAVDAIRLARRTLGIIKGKLFWAFAYNIVLIPVAAAGLLNPLLAGAAMAMSSLFVVTNSLRLRNFA
ncbi:MAG: HAD-IC family P-type ATPase [Geodermatophilaceae bacterium]